MKCNQPRPGFELESPCSFPTTITITPRAPSLWWYQYSYTHTISIICSTADAISSSCWSILFKVLTLNVANGIEPKIEKNLRKNQIGFRWNQSTTSQIQIIRQIFQGVRAKSLGATHLFVDYFKAFNSICRGEMEQILLPYGLPRETVAAIMILYKKNIKVKICSLDWDRFLWHLHRYAAKGHVSNIPV